MPEDLARELGFPVYGPKPLTARKCREMLGSIHPDAQAVIKRLQPHNRGDEFASDPLWKLHQLNNADKHRVPHVTRMAVAAYADFSDAPHLPGTININLGPFEDGAKIASYAPFADEEFDPYVHMDPLLTFGIVFGQGSATAGLDCGVALRWMRSHIVNRVLPPLAPYLA